MCILHVNPQSDEPVYVYDTKYPNLGFKLHFVRRVESPLISTLIPSFLFVAISYLALYVPKDAIVVRNSICMFMLLTM